MTWARIDDSFYCHPKYAGMSLEELGLIVCAIAYSNHYLTDGRIPRAMMHAFGDGKRNAKVAMALVNRPRPILKLTEDGYEILGYLDHNPSRAEVLTKLQAKKDAARRGGERSWEVRSSSVPPPPVEALTSTNTEAVTSTDSSNRQLKHSLQPSAEVPGSTNVEVSAEPRSSPLLSSPIQKEINPPVSPPEGGKRKRSENLGSRIPLDWQPGPSEIDWLRKQGVLDDSDGVASFVDFWKGLPGKQALKCDWGATYRNDVRRRIRKGELAPMSGVQVQVEWMPSRDDEPLPMDEAARRSRALLERIATQNASEAV